MLDLKSAMTIKMSLADLINNVGAAPHTDQNRLEPCHSNKGIGFLLALAMVAFLVIGIMLAVVEVYPFWLVIAVWAIAIAVLPAILRDDLRDILAWWLLAPIALAFIVELVGTSLGYNPWQITSPFSWIIAPVSIFGLCLATMTFIDEHGEMNMNGRFFAVVTFIFFEAVMVLEGPIGYYSDAWLGTDYVPGNTELMIYVIMNTAVGLLLGYLVNSYFRNHSYDDFKAHVGAKRLA
jgi:hypothetical protein